MTGRGRPPIGPAIKIRFPSETLELVDCFAARYGMKRADALRILVAAGLDYVNIDELLGKPRD